MGRPKKYKTPKERLDATRRIKSNWKKRHPESGARRFKSRPEIWLKSWLKTKYGMTITDFESKVVEQGGVCAICGQTNIVNGVERRLCVDHDHRTGQLRGLLCRWCNAAIGLLDDDCARLEAAITYLKRFNQ